MESRDRTKYVKYVILGALLMTIMLVISIAWIKKYYHNETPDDIIINDLPGVKGTIFVSTFGNNAFNTNPTRHVSVFVNNQRDYRMEDNDIRGYLDGTFKWGWNQPTQIHVRLGRRDTAPKYGEYELFRVLQRWDQIVLPPFTEIKNAKLSIMIEGGLDRTFRVLLYEVKKDWNPGEGGTLRNNVSPPVKGEVWWNDIGYLESSWGLPGAGYVTERESKSDTGIFPLDEVVCYPGNETIEFNSDRLTKYISGQVNKGKPLLFLLKLSDFQEDLPVGLLNLYSANHGDIRNLQRRPHLSLEWESFSEKQSISKEVFIEYGRQYITPRFETDNSTCVAISFISEKGYLNPTINVQGGTENKISKWIRWPTAINKDWDWCQFNILASYDPIVIGQIFTSELADTWIRTKPPEEQVVNWIFISPTGIRHERSAEYIGDYKWKIEFTPNELGRWRYWWTQNFTSEPYISSIAEFDVIGGNEKNIQLHIQDFMSEIADYNRVEYNRKGKLLTKIYRKVFKDIELKDKRPSFTIRFMRLERAAMQNHTDESFASESGTKLRRQLNQIRGLLGESAPDQIPMK